MATTIHVPDALLRQVDRRAKALRLSRNRLILRALEREVKERSTWSPEFLEQLRHVDADLPDAVDDLLAGIKKGRRSKSPVRL